MLSILQALKDAARQTEPKHPKDSEEHLFELLEDNTNLHNAFSHLLAKDLTDISEEKKLMAQYLLKITEEPQECILPELKIIIEFIKKQTHPALLTDVLTQFIRNMGLYPSFKYKLNCVIGIIEGYQDDRYNDAQQLIDELIEIDEMNKKQAGFFPARAPYIEGIIRSPMVTIFFPNESTQAAGSASAASATGGATSASFTHEEAQKCELRLYSITKSIFEIIDNLEYFTLRDLLGILAICVTHAEHTQHSPMIKNIICQYISDFYEAQVLREKQHETLKTLTESNQFSKAYEHLNVIIEDAADACYQIGMEEILDNEGIWSFNAP